MARKKILSEDSAESAVDVFEAVRRALMRRGLVRQKKSESVPQEESKDKKLSDVARKSHEIIFKANTVFPFTLFPDTVTLDREKFTIAHRSFFRIAKITSTPVRDVLSAEVDVGPFFGSIHVSSRFFISGPYSVNFMWRADAMKLGRLLQGYVIAHEQEIDCAHIEKDKLIELLNRLGKGDTD